MLTYNLDKKSKIPLYIQLYDKIKSDIEQGKIESNEKLPSKRALAEHHMLSIITVQNAYAQLFAEGYIYSRERSGYFASEILQLNDESKSKKKKRFFEPVEVNPEKDTHYLIDISANSMNKAHFPFAFWSKQMRQVMNTNQDALLEQVPSFGLFSLRFAISEYLLRYRGMTVDPNCILIGAGTEHLYTVLVKLLGRKNIFAVENPCYNKIISTYTSENVEIEHISLDDNGINIDELNRSKANIIHISPAHNFPTGIVMPIKRRMEVLEWAHKEENRFIIEDDYDSEFRFASKPLPTLQGIDMQGKTVYMNTFSKTITPSLRISYMILPPKLAAKYQENLSFISCPVCSFEQHILEHFISQGYYERHISRMRKYYKQHRDSIMKIIDESPLREKSEIKEELSGLHFILRMKTRKNDQEIKELAKEYGLKTSFLSEFYVKNLTSKNSEEKKRTKDSYAELIVNYSGINSEAMKKAIKILSKII